MPVLVEPGGACYDGTIGWSTLHEEAIPLKIENNILKHYLRNVYFITGTAYAGKSTMVKMLAERYDMVFCGENYYIPVSDAVATPDVQPDLCYRKTSRIGRILLPAHPRNMSRWDL